MKDRIASRIASNAEKTKQFLQQLREQEVSSHDMDGWIAAFVNKRIVGIAIAVWQGDSGLVAEVAVIPQFRKKIGTWLALEALQRLRSRRPRQIFPGVDV